MTQESKDRLDRIEGILEQQALKVDHLFEAIGQTNATVDRLGKRVDVMAGAMQDLIKMQVASYDGPRETQ